MQKTRDSYRETIRDYYLKVYTGILSPQPSPGDLKNICISKIEGLSNSDREILRQTFNFDSSATTKEIEKSIDKYDKWKPIQNFLKEGTKTQNSLLVELVAILIGFKSRPFKNFLKSNEPINFEQTEELSEETHSINSKTVEKKNQDNTPQKEESKNNTDEKNINSSSVVNQINNRIENNITVPPTNWKWPVLLSVAIVILIIVVMLFSNTIFKTGSQPITSPHKIEVSASYPFFDEQTKNPQVWYIKKNRNEVEFFDAPGLHPKTGKTLRAVTPHIIQTYVPHNLPVESLIEDTNRYIEKNKEDTIFSSTFFNTTENSELGIIAFNNNKLDTEVISHLKSLLQSQFVINTSVIIPSKINKNIQESLQIGDFKALPGNINKHVDYMMVIGTHYEYRESTLRKGDIICTMNIKANMFDVNTGEVLNTHSFNKKVIGRGWSKSNAKNNTLTKLEL